MNVSTVFESVAPQFTVPDVVRTAEYYRDILAFGEEAGANTDGDAVG